MRELIFAGKNSEAERLIQENMLGEYDDPISRWAICIWNTKYYIEIMKMRVKLKDAADEAEVPKEDLEQ